ncbi:MAG: HD domain-containing protein, partial [Halioglobus sp.]|nr:HD domain-containing protein [Halioglobus sp.]
MIAQTNLQLYRQLHAAGYSGDDIGRVQRAHEFALPAFSAQYRASGKPFIAHLVGTASVLANQGERAELLLAGLLHAVYSNGDLGIEPGKRQSARRRRLVRDQAGEGVETLIAAYDDSQWNAEGIRIW